MAVVLEFNLICQKYVDLKLMFQNFEIKKLEISIEKIISIDNWMWANQKELKHEFLIDTSLNESKIIAINLRSTYLKDLGIFVEKISGEYIYNFWVNTDGYPNLDSDEINENNMSYFEKFYRIFEEIIERQNIGFRILGIGLETNFQYGKNTCEVIKNSNNIIAWVVNRDLGSYANLINYKKNKMDGLNFFIFEK